MRKLIVLIALLTAPLLTHAQNAGDPCLPGQAPTNQALGLSFLCKQVGGVYQLVINPAGGGGGANPAGNNGDTQIKSGTNLAAGGQNDNGTTIVNKRDNIYQGPNPYVDPRNFGVRAVNPNVAPAIPGITANCVAGNLNMVVSNASNFIIGDGITVPCGSPNTMSTPTIPTVTPSTAAALPGTGYVSTAPAGAVSGPCYKIVLRDTAFGLTPASPEFCVTNGVPLGAQTLAITSISTSAGTNTVTTAARTPEVLAVGDMIQIGGTSLDGQYGGWYIINTVPNNTTFTYKTGNNTLAGAPTVAATGGTFTFWNCNHLAFPAPGGGNPYQFAVYAGATGAETLYAVSGIVNSTLSSDSSYLTWDDFGSPMMSNGQFSYQWPNTPPSSPVPDSLVTTITNIVGNTLTLAVAPTSNNATATILFDNTAPTIAAFTAANNSQAMVQFPTIPFGTAFVYNSFLDLTSFNGVGVSVAGQLWLNDTIKTNNIWHGDLTLAGLQTTQFALSSYPPISINRANPGIIATTSGWSGIYFKNLAPNVYLSFFENQGSIPSIWFSNCAFTGGGGSDYMGVNYYQFSNATAGNNAAGVRFDNTTFNSGTTNGAPTFISKNFGEINISGTMGQGRGFFFKAGGTGSGVDFNMKYELQAPSTPLITVYGVVNSTMALTLTNFIEDTGSMPMVANFLPGFVSVATNSVIFVNSNIPAFTGFPIVPVTGGTLQPTTTMGTNTNLSGIRTGGITDGVIGAGGNAPLQAERIEALHHAMEPGYSFFTDVGQPPAPTCATITAGPPFSPLQTNTTFAYTGVFPNGGSGLLSPRSNACSADGATQQIIVTIPAAITGAIGYNVYGNSLVGCSTPSTIGLTFPATAAYCGNQPPQLAGGGPAGIQNGQIWGQPYQGGTGSPLAAASPVMGYYIGPQCPTSNAGQCFFSPANTRVDYHCTWSAASTTLTCSDNPFVITDVGKQVMGWSTCETDLPITGYTGAITGSGTGVYQISSFTDSGHVVLSATPFNTQASAGCLVYGNPDDAGFAALSAAVAAQSSYCPKVFLAAGQYMISKPFLTAQPAGCSTIFSLANHPTYGNLDLPAGFEVEGRGAGNTIVHIANNFPNGASLIVNNAVSSWFVIPPLGGWRDLAFTGDGQAGTCAGISGNVFNLIYMAVAKLTDVTLTNFCSIMGNTTSNNYLGVGVYSDLLGQFTRVNLSAFGAIGLRIAGNGANSNALQTAIENTGTMSLDVVATDGTNRWSFQCWACYFTGANTFNIAQLGNNRGVVNVAGGATLKLSNSQILNCPIPTCNTSASSPVLINSAGSGSRIYLDKVTEATQGTATNTAGLLCDVGNNCTVWARDTIFTNTAGANSLNLRNNTDILFDESGNNLLIGAWNTGTATPTIISDGHMLTGVCTGVATSSSTLGLYNSEMNPTNTTTTCTAATVGAGYAVAQARTLQGFQCTSSATTVSVACTVVVNGGPSTITCTMTAAVLCNDNGHSVALNKGDRISVQIATGVAETGANIKAQILIQ